MLRFFILSILALSSQLIFAQGKINRQSQPNSVSTSTKLSVSGSLNGHDYVDLGLPSGNLWATTNIGASTPTEYGDYFAWAEISPKEEYSIFTSISEKWRFRELVNDFEKKSYKKAPVNNIIGDIQYDAATANWGSEWHLPSTKDYEEVVSKCTWKLITLQGNKGFLVTGPNGNKIFFPLAGYMEKAGPNQLHCLGEHGIYWTGDQNDKNTNEHLSYAFCLYHPQYNKGVTPHTRYVGHSIRAVINNDQK